MAVGILNGVRLLCANKRLAVIEPDAADTVNVQCGNDKFETLPRSMFYATMLRLHETQQQEYNSMKIPT